ncbi:MAG: S9 family peptidase [Bacteroidales bacterium]|nr:S9 family peptidase [Bacteroidales bacterium]
MLKPLFLSAALLASGGIFSASALTPGDYCDPEKNAPASVKDMTPMPDGESYLCVGKKGATIERYSYKTGKLLETVFDVSTIKGSVKIDEFDGFEVSDNGSMLLLWNDSEGIYRHSFTAQYYVYDIGRGTMKRVSENGRQRGAIISHDGTMVAFTRDNDIYITNLDFDTERRVTENGKEGAIINGVPDWGYEEEFGIVNTMRWAPDDSSLAFVTFNESEVPSYHFDIYPNYCNTPSKYDLYPGEYTYKYPLAGDNNSIVKVSVYNIDSRLTKVMDLPISETDYVPSVEYGGAPDRLMVMILNRDQNNLRLYSVNPGSTVAKLLLTETSQAWLSPSAYQMVDYRKDAFVIGSDRSGWRHLYEYDYSGNLRKQLTSGNYYVTEYYGYNPTTREHYFQTTQNGSTERNVAHTTAAGVQMLNPQKGWESASFSKGLQYYVRTYSNITTPPVYGLYSLKGKITDLELNAEYAARYAEMPKPELVEIPMPDGQKMNAYIIKPANFSDSRKYPVLHYQYNGPESQEVRNRWSVGGMNYLASEGYVIVCADGRGTGFRGRAWCDVVYKSLGKFETEDQLTAASWSSKQPWADASRMACFGWSYGGYMTLMELTAPGTPFKAGISMAPVTDWRFYDSIYTERYMLTPKQNSTGYDAASTLPRTENLKARLLIMSGTSDDNVHIFNTYKYTAKLTSEGTICDMMVWTAFDHSLRPCGSRTVLYRKTLDFLNSNLR